MKAAAAVSVTGLLSLILLEVLKIILEPLLVWGFGMLLIVAKFALIAFATGLGLAALVATFFVVRTVRKRRGAAV